MRTIYPIPFIIILAVLISCKKPADPDHGNNAPALTGKWQLVSDSTSYGGGYFGDPSGKIYTGVSGDYYDFDTNGLVYIREASAIDTGHYTITDQKIQIGYDQPGNPGHLYYTSGPLAMSNFTTHSLTLTSGIMSPEGFYGEVLKLRR